MKRMWLKAYNLKSPLVKTNGKEYCSELMVMLFSAQSFADHFSERNDHINKLIIFG